VAQGSAIVIMVGTLLILWSGMVAHHHGHPSAKFFVLAWSVLCVGAFVSGLRSFDWLETNIMTANAVQLSSAVEMLLLSFALAHRIKVEREATVHIQQLLVNTLKDSEAKLEKTVIARTEALKQSLRHEQEALEKFIRFGSYISHEFRNPLAIIKNQCATLQKERAKKIDENIDKRIITMLTASDRIGQLFDSWIHSDRLRQGSAILSITDINAHQFLSNLVQQCQHLYQEHPISYIPNEDTQITFNADEDMIRIAMINLIDNAVKYSPNATPIQIQLVLEKTSQLGIMVEDQGNGMNLSEHPHLFQDYFRLDGDKSKTKGFGLGLGFVSKICELHNGSVTVHSELGKGSQFCIWLSREYSKK
jgi:signal transduction histidine kinase